MNYYSLVFLIISGDKGGRTPDLKTASLALSQLSYVPKSKARQCKYSSLKKQENCL